MRQDHDASLSRCRYSKDHEFSWLPGALDEFYARSNYSGILAWYALPQQSPGRDAWWYVGRNAVIRQFAEDRRESEGRKIVVLPSDHIARSIDAVGTPTRNCRHEPGSNTCLDDLHFGCGIMSYFNTSIPVRALRSAWTDMDPGGLGRHQGAARLRLPRSVQSRGPSELAERRLLSRLL